MNLSKLSELKDCLESARKKNEPSRVDLLSGLELEGDYLTFHENQFEQASEQYEKMLKYDPGNLHALWSLTGLYSGELARMPEAPAKAGRYAA